jgi:hypothetical protein
MRRMRARAATLESFRAATRSAQRNCGACAMAAHCRSRSPRTSPTPRATADSVSCSATPRGCARTPCRRRPASRCAHGSFVALRGVGGRRRSRCGRARLRVAGRPLCALHGARRAAHAGARRVALLVPSKLWSALAGGGIRGISCAARRRSHWTPGTTPPPASTPLCTRRRSSRGGSRAGSIRRMRRSRVMSAVQAARACGITAHHTRRCTRSWSVARDTLALDTIRREHRGCSSAGRARCVRSAYRRRHVARLSPARPAAARREERMQRSVHRAPRHRGRTRSSFVRVHSGTVHGLVERALLRPLVRGEHLRAVGRRRRCRTSAIVWTHDACDEPGRVLPREGARWLGGGDAASSSAATDVARVGGRSFARRPRAATVPAWSGATSAARRARWCSRPAIPRCRSTPATWSASPLPTTRTPWPRCSTRAWRPRGSRCSPSRRAAAIAGIWGGPVRGSPIPRDWPAARERLAPLGRSRRRAARGAAPDPRELDAAVLEVFRVRADVVAPLILVARSPDRARRRLHVAAVAA